MIILGEGSNVKQKVVNLINNLPEDVTIEDIQYHLFVRQKILNAEKQIEMGETIPHAEVMEKIRKKWSP